MPGKHPFLLCFYGDDFTGSTDALEFLERAGLRTALFVGVPTTEQIDELEGVAAIGVTGNSRSLPTGAMESVLRPAFERLRDIGAPLLHYKICSTFDSSPQVGSIGRVIEIGADVCKSGPVPLLVGAPALGRYCVFGNLFARSGLDTEPFRLDRHPTMSRHPVTPMSESDLRAHLGAQTERSVELLDILRVADSSEIATARYAELASSGPAAILIDILHQDELSTVGDVLWRQTGDERPLFVVGSSGVEMALGAAWSKLGLAPGAARFPDPGRAEPLLVLSGSCSPVTRNQCRFALERGFAEVELETGRLATKDVDEEVERAAAAAALAELRRGRSVILHTALGPDDARIVETRRLLAAATASSDAEQKELCGRRLGRSLGRIGHRILSELALTRVVVTGGDTSGHVATELGIERLEMIAPMAPGSPLCRARGKSSPADGIEFVFKGGQLGKVDLIPQTIVGRP